MPVFKKNTLAQSAAYLSNRLRQSFLIDDVESLIVEGHLVACVRLGEQLRYIFADTYRGLKNGEFTLVADSREDLKNGLKTVLRQYGPIEFKPDHVVILKEELDEFVASMIQGERSHSSQVVHTQPLQRTKALQDTIIATLAQLRVNALAVPKNKPGQPGVRSTVWECLERSPQHFKRRAFEKAWQALRNSGEIQDA